MPNAEGQTAVLRPSSLRPSSLRPEGVRREQDYHHRRAGVQDGDLAEHARESNLTRNRRPSCNSLSAGHRQE